MKNKNPHKTAFVRPHKSCSEKTQRLAALEWGATAHTIFTQKVGKEDIRMFLGQLRPGDHVGIFRVDLFVARGNSTKPRRPILRTVIDKLFRQEVVVFELETGRSCRSKQELVQMYDDAIRRLAGERNQQAGPGRPKKQTYTDEQKAEILTIWNDKRLKTNAERVAKVKEKYSQFNEAAFYKFIRNTEERD